MVAVTARKSAELDGFVGRAVESRLLRSCADKIRTGSPQLVRIEGEAGIGKTYLINHFLAHLDGVTVLAASGDPGESTLSFGLLDQLVARADRALVGKYPLLGRGRGRGAPATPFGVGADLLDLIGELQADQPLLIVVDDAQWADRASAQALGFALRRLWADQVLAVLVVRTPLVGDEADVVTQYLSRLPLGTTTICLDGLTTPDIAALSGAVTSGELPLPAAARLRAHTGGNPLYVRALLAESSPKDLIAGSTNLPVPRPLMVAVGRILARLPESTRRLVEALAVLNTRCSLARVAQLASVDKPSEALAPALAAGLVHWWPTEPTNPVVMKHGLHRDAVYEALDPVRRAELHASAARLVNTRAAWAHRVAAAQTADGGLARELERAAAEETGAGEHDIAARYLHWAAELSESRDEYERRLLTACVQSLLTYHPGWAVRMRPEMLQCSDTPLRASALGLTALLGTGELSVAEEWLDRAARMSPADDLRSTVSGALAALRFWRGRSEEALRDASRALSTGTMPARFADFVRLIRAVARARVDGLSAGLADLADLPRQATAVSVDDLERLSCRGALRVMLGQFELAVEDLTATIRHQRAGAGMLGGPTPHSYLAAAQYATGAWEDALISVHQALSIQTSFEQPQHFTLAQMVATFVPAARGEWAVAEGHVEAARRWAAKVATPQDERYAAIAGAALAQARGDHAAMLASLRPLRDIDQDEADELHAWWLSWWRPLLVEALIGVGELDAAAEHLDHLRKATEDVLRLDMTLVRLRAALAREQGRLDHAVDIYRRGLECEDGEPAPPFPLAMVRHDFGLLLSATGHRRDALRWLHRAREGYAALSANPFVRRVDDVLSSSGVRPSDSSARRLPELTDREEQASYLACRGMTNAEIAKELYVTTKTVEYHLSNVYAKLGVGSRRELRAALAKEGVTEPSW